jgi:hypothetical protein
MKIIDANLIIHSVIILSFFLMQFFEMISFGSRTAGKLVNRIGLGTTLQQSIYTSSRFLLIFFLPLLGYVVEYGLSMERYIALVVSTFTLSFIASIFILIKLNYFQAFFQKVFTNYSNNTIPAAILKSIPQNKYKIKPKLCESFSFKKIIWKKTFVSVIAYLFLISSYFVAFTFAIIYPENRLTLSQFTAVFHSFGAIIMSFYLDPMLSRSIDVKSDNIVWLKNTYSILLGRVISYLIALIVLLICLFFIVSSK